MTPSLVLLAATATITTSSAAVDQKPQAPLFAIVVGNNHPLPGSDYEVLRYADDDALRFAEYFESLGARVFLMTGADEDTAARFGAAANRARIPTRAMFDATLIEVEKALEAVRDQQPELFFYFSGHGTITSADAYLHLLDGPFSRNDLQERVLARLPAHRTHVIIDSCHSYFVVNARGERVPAAIEDDSLDRFPGAGFLLSTSADVEVQEWSGYQAGVFSYQVLGALQGAADVDLDGVVTYAEVHAYLVAANLGVQNTKARINPFVRRPSVRGHTILDLHRADPSRRLEVPATLAGHFYLTDGVGRRVLDANKPPGTLLALVGDRTRDLYVFAGEQTFGVQRDERGLQIGPAVSDDRSGISSRGPLADEFRRSLFKRPLTPEFVAGVEAMSTRAPSVQLDPRRTPATAWHDDGLTIGILGAGGAAAVLGTIGAVFFANASTESNRRPITVDVENARVRAENFRAVTIGSFSAAGALLVVGVLRAAFTNEAFSTSAEP